MPIFVGWPQITDLTTPMADADGHTLIRRCPVMAPNSLKLRGTIRYIFFQWGGFSITTTFIFRLSKTTSNIAYIEKSTLSYKHHSIGTLADRYICRFALVTQHSPQYYTVNIEDDSTRGDHRAESRDTGSSAMHNRGYTRDTTFLN